MGLKIDRGEGASRKPGLTVGGRGFLMMSLKRGGPQMKCSSINGQVLSVFKQTI
jgi:hypothetical protein